MLISPQPIDALADLIAFRLNGVTIIWCSLCLERVNAVVLIAIQLLVCLPRIRLVDNTDKEWLLGQLRSIVLQHLGVGLDELMSHLLRPGQREVGQEQLRR
jgi:hypothetical protein